MLEKKNYIHLIKYFIKLCLAAGLIAYLFHSKYINFSSIYDSIDNYEYIILAALLLLCATLLNVYRWNLLLIAHGINLSVVKLITLSFIGLFFTAVLPGAVSGDIIKGLYISKEVPNKKTGAVVSVFIDRIVGLISLFIVSILGFIAEYDRIIANDPLKYISFVILSVFLGLFIVFLLGLSRTINRIIMKYNYLESKLIFKYLFKVYRAFHDYQKNYSYLILSLLVSLISTICFITAFYMISFALGFKQLSFLALFFIIPVGLICTTIPLTPAGIGVGQIVFFKLYEWSLGFKTTIGADSVTIWQVISMFIYLSGGFFFLFYRSDYPINE